MARDYAKRKTDSPKRKPSTVKRRANDKQSPPAKSGRLGAFIGGLVTGVFLSFLLYLGTLNSDDTQTNPGQAVAQPKAQPPKPRFDFYTLLPEQSIDVELEPAPDVSKPTRTATAEVYILQAGSFRQRDDADRRRAELLLLGLEPNVEAIEGDNGRWFRVYLGPYESRSTMARARSLTANQDIDTLLLKRDRPR